MNVWDYLDRASARRAAHPRPSRDIRQLIGFAFLAGYYLMVWRFATGEVPSGNLDLIRDAMLTLGPPVGLIVGAMFRSDLRDEQTARNTGEAFRAVREVAANSAGPSGAPGDPVSVTPEPARTGGIGDYQETGR